MFQHPFKKDPPTLLPISSTTTPARSPINTPAITDHPADPFNQLPHAQNEQPPTSTSTSTSTFTRRTKPPPLPISIPHASHPHLTTSTATTPNWNDVPLAWQTAGTTPRATSAASSTAFDINVLYATANPRATPRRRQSSMIREKEIAAAVKAGLISPAAQTPGWQPGSGMGGYRDEQDGDRDEWSRDRKIESARNSISVAEADGGYGVIGGRRRRGSGRNVAKGFMVVILLATVCVLGVWIRGGPFTGSSSSSSSNVGSVGADGEYASPSMFEGWGLNKTGKLAAGANSAGVSMAEFGERCMAWGSGWRSLVPGFLSRYFSQGSSRKDGVRDETMTQTVRLEQASGWFNPGISSRITRGNMNGNGEMTESAGSTDTATQAEETILSNPTYMTPEEAQARLGEILSGQISSGAQTADGPSDATPTVLLGGGKVKIDEEAESRRARAARASEMWMKHVPVRPVHDVGHEGREYGHLDRREL